MAFSVRYADATREHAWQLSQAMRQADRDEVRASGGFTPYDAALTSLEKSEVAWTLVFNDCIAAMWGLAAFPELGENVAVPWLLTTDVVDRYPMTFLRCCKSELDVLLDWYPVLVQAIDARHQVAVRWAKWLGFEVKPAAPHGVEGRPFHPIILRAKERVKEAAP